MGLFPDNIGREIRKKFSEVRKEHHKTIYIYGAPNEEDCPNCYKDPATGLSTGQYDTSFTSPTTIFGEIITPQSFTRGRCPVCYGQGVLTQDVRAGIKVLIRWNPPGTNSRGELEKTSAGLEGFNIVRIKAKKKYYTTLRDCRYALIDGVRCELTTPPVFRSVGKEDVAVVAYFSSTEEGHNIRS